MVSVVQLSWTWSHWYLAQRAENHRKWQQTKGKIAPACVLWGVGGFFGGQSTDPPKKSVATGQFLSSLRASQISLDIWVYIYIIWCNLPFYSIHPSNKVAQMRGCGTVKVSRDILRLVLLLWVLSSSPTSRPPNRSPDPSMVGKSWGSFWFGWSRVVQPSGV